MTFIPGSSSIHGRLILITATLWVLSSSGCAVEGGVAGSSEQGLSAAISLTQVMSPEGAIARATVRLTDERGEPVAGAEVYGAFTGVSLVTAQATTGSTGSAVLVMQVEDGAELGFDLGAVTLVIDGESVVLYPESSCASRCSLSAELPEEGTQRPKDGPATSSGVEEETKDGPATSSGVEEETKDGPATSSGVEEETKDGPATSSGVEEETTDGPATSSGVEIPPAPGPATSS